MKRILMIVLLVSIMVLPVSAMDFTAPSAPNSAMQYMPPNSSSFTEDLLFIVKAALKDLQPQLFEVLGVCANILTIIMITSILGCIAVKQNKVLNFVAVIAISALMFRSTDSMIEFGKQTVVELAEYGKLLLPVLTGALAAQGGTATSAALYAGTAMFTSLLSSIISSFMIPMVYIYVCLSIANSAIGEAVLSQIRDFIKWLLTWSLKIVIYVFTGYMAVTGVISGTVDASAIKATKLTLSGAVPVVGSILSDASETILVSAGIMKNSVGVYGLLAISAILIGPFIKIGTQYILLKGTGTISCVIGSKGLAEIIDHFSSAMGFILAMTGTVSLLLMISVVCFMKGVA